VKFFIFDSRPAYPIEQAFLRTIPGAPGILVGGILFYERILSKQEMFFLALAIPNWEPNGKSGDRA
jgi:hypothetical protein